MYVNEARLLSTALQVLNWIFQRGKKVFLFKSEHPGKQNTIQTVTESHYNKKPCTLAYKGKYSF